MLRHKEETMEYEYVALSWTTHYPGGDTEFGADKDRLLAEGWQTDVQARFEPKRIGGACIMRRLKDEPQDKPRMWTEAELRGLVRAAQPSAKGYYVYDPDDVSTEALPNKALLA